MNLSFRLNKLSTISNAELNVEYTREDSKLKREVLRALKTEA